VIVLANHHRLTPTLHAEMASGGLLDDAEVGVREYLRLIYALNADRNAAIKRQLDELTRTLDAVGVRPVFLKGAATLLDGPYSEIGERMIGDIDLLVPPDAIGRCLAAMQADGYRVIRRYPMSHNAFGDLAKDGNPAAVDVHLEPTDSPHTLFASEVRAAAREVSSNRFALLVPGRTHRLLHNLLHAEVHDVGGYYHGRLPLRDLHEFSIMCEGFAADIDWAFVTHRMQQNRMGVVLQSYVLAAKRLFGARCPISDRAPVRARLHFVRRLAQFRMTWLARVGVPWWNVRAAFAHHRMKALYGQTGGRPITWRLRHGSRYLANNTLSVARSRLLRV
jgi:hypothetical protein